jgi:transposase InsO family protein
VPRIHGELLKLGIEVSETTIAKYMVRHRKPPSQSRQAFLKNHTQQLVSADFFVVPTLSFRLLFVLVVLEHHRRRVVHFNVTAHPTAEWTAQQMLEAFPRDKAPRFLIRDRDGCYGDAFRQAVRGMNIREILTAPHSPWQNGFVERLIGSIRRECLDHVIIFNESSLRKILRSYLWYYERSRTHLALGKDAPEPRTVHPPELGEVVELPEVGGLHHRYECRAA